MTRGGLDLGLLLSGDMTGEPAAVFAAYQSLASAARDAGFRAIVAGQHFLTAPARYLQPIPLLARLAPETGDMFLVTGVLLASLIPPVILAEDLATLDVVSGGRLVVGVGQGYRDVEFAAFGVPRAERRDRQLDALAVLEQLWSGSETHIERGGLRIHAAGPAMVPQQRPRPPIWYAASSPATVERARVSDYTPYLGPQVSSREVGPLLQAGGDPGAGAALRRDILLTDVLDTATVRACLAAREERYRSWGYLDPTGSRDRADGSDTPYLIGTVEECRQQLVDLGADGVTTVVLRATWPGLALSESLRMVDALSGVARALRGDLS